LGHWILLTSSLLLLVSLAVAHWHSNAYIRESVSAAAALVCLALVAETPNMVVVGGILSVWGLRFVLESRFSPVIAGAVVGVIGLVHAIAGGHSDYGHAITVSHMDVAFLATHLNPVTLFAVTQLVLLNRGIRESTRIDWLSINSGLVLLITLSISMAFALGLCTGGVQIDRMKVDALMRSSGSGGFLLFVALMSMHALIVATIEESLFRGVLQNGIRNLLGKKVGSRQAIWGSILISSVLFGLVHFRLGVDWMIGAAIAGVGYGVVYEISKGKLPFVVIVHALVILLITAVLRNG
jgi:membrane protease YdiL (CAAX protease family)